MPHCRGLEVPFFGSFDFWGYALHHYFGQAEILFSVSQMNLLVGKGTVPNVRLMACRRCKTRSAQSSAPVTDCCLPWLTPFSPPKIKDPETITGRL